MFRKMLLAIALMSLLLPAAVLAQPTPKRFPPRHAAIWGMETAFGVRGAKPHLQNRSLGASTPTAGQPQQRTGQPRRANSLARTWR